MFRGHMSASCLQGGRHRHFTFTLWHRLLHGTLTRANIRYVLRPECFVAIGASLIIAS